MKWKMRFCYRIPLVLYVSAKMSALQLWLRSPSLCAPPTLHSLHLSFQCMLQHVIVITSVYNDLDWQDRRLMMMRFAGTEDDADTETAKASQIRELGNGMLALQDQLIQIAPQILRDLLRCLQQHVDNGKDIVLSASGDVSTAWDFSQLWKLWSCPLLPQHKGEFVRWCPDKIHSLQGLICVWLQHSSGLIDQISDLPWKRVCTC